MLVLCGLLGLVATIVWAKDSMATGTSSGDRYGGDGTTDANADPDGVGCPTHETELGTFPDLADTDEDGLNDGEKSVLADQSAEPRRRHLTDGEEVRIA
jgi:hypothetical protein